GAPEGHTSQHAESYVEKKKDQCVPNKICAEQELRLIQQILFILLWCKALMRSVVKRQACLNYDEAGQCKKEKDEEMRPGPRDAEIFRQGRPGCVRGRRGVGGVRDGIAGERGGRRLDRGIFVLTGLTGILRSSIRRIVSRRRVRCGA